MPRLTMRQANLIGIHEHVSRFRAQMALNQTANIRVYYESMWGDMLDNILERIRRIRSTNNENSNS
jgi:hypothetical protein